MVRVGLVGLALALVCGVLWAAAPAAWNDDNSILLIARDEALAKVVRAILGSSLPFEDTRIKAYVEGAFVYEGRGTVAKDVGKFVTDEGTEIPFSDLFTRDSIEGAQAIRALHEEYGATLLAVLWVEVARTAVDPAYGLSKKKLSFVLKWLDGATGETLLENILDEKLGFAVGLATKVRGTEEFESFPTAGDGSDTFLTERFQALLTPEKGMEIRAQVAPLLRAGASAGQRLAVVITDLDQDTYMERRPDFVALVSDAGAAAKVRDTYKRAGQELTLRTTFQGDFDVFFRALYRLARDREIFDKYDVIRDQDLYDAYDVSKLPAGRSIVIKPLDPERKFLIVSGMTAKQYHDRLAIYRSALEAQPGIKDIEFRYIPGQDAGDSVTIFAFTYDEDLTALEAALWQHLKKDGRIPNRELLAITETEIRYRTGRAEQDEQTIVALFNNITPAVYREMGIALDGILKGLEVRNIEKAYDKDTCALAYGFDTTLPPVEIDTILWNAILADDRLDHIVQDSTHHNLVAYFYLEESRPAEDDERRAMTILVRNLSPSDYSGQGKGLVALIRSMDSAHDFEHSYTEQNETLRMAFASDLDSIYPYDDAIWAAVKGDPGLASLAMGTLTRTEATYFFKPEEAEAAEEPGTGIGVIVFLKDVGGQVYIRVASAFYDLISTIPDVQEVTYTYDFGRKTVMYRFRFTGKRLFDFEEALQRRLPNHALLEAVAKGLSFLNRLEYVYHLPEGKEGQPVALVIGAPNDTQTVEIRKEAFYFKKSD